jgi:hypothetical protein
MDAYKNTAPFAELSSIGLTPRKIARIERARGMRLRVESGKVWITQERCREDTILAAGESCTVEHDGVTLISALSVPFALVAMEPAVAPRRTYGERFWAFWTALYASTSRPTSAAL